MKASVSHHSFCVSFQKGSVEIRCLTKELLQAARRVFHLMLDEQPEGKRFQAGSYQVFEDPKGKFLLTGKNGEEIISSRRLSAIQHQLKSEVSLELIRANPQFLWLHASGVSRQGRTVLVAGQSGRGKSSLATELCRQGWNYLGDDMLPLEPESGRIFPFPATAMKRKQSDTWLPAAEVNRLERSWIEIEPKDCSQEACPVAGIVLPQFHPEGDHQMKATGGGAVAMELLNGCINFVDHKTEAISRLCRLIETVPVHNLTWSDPGRAARAIARIHE